MNKYNIGDYVTTKKYKNKGRITEIHGKCPESQSWIDGQSIPVTEEELNGIWYSILCEPSGAVTVSENDVVEVDPFPFTNMWKDDYFKDHKILEVVTTHDGYDQNEEPCKFVEVIREGKLYSINDHRMYELPVDWDGDASYDHCYICGKEIRNKTDDIYWWTDGSHACRDMSPFSFTNGGGCMDILIGRGCQKKYGMK